MAWPVKRAVAEAIGFDELVKHGTPEPLHAAVQTRRSIAIAVDAAVRDVIKQASNRRGGS